MRNERKYLGMLPTIGIVADVTNRNNLFINYVSDAAVQAIKQAGGVPIIFPSSPPQYAEVFLDKCDGMLFLGKSDIDPTLYEEEPIPELGYTYRQKDELELELVRQSYAAGKAILGICRGIQVINVGLGGTVYQDLAEQEKRKRVKHFQSSPIFMPTHHINVAPGSQLEELIGSYPMVNSRHHEAVKDIGNDLKITARAADGCIEAIESVNSNQLLAVQWNPEYLNTSNFNNILFRNFISRVEDRVLKKSSMND